MGCEGAGCRADGASVGSFCTVHLSASANEASINHHLGDVKKEVKEVHSCSNKLPIIFYYRLQIEVTFELSLSKCSFILNHFD